MRPSGDYSKASHTEIMVNMIEDGHTKEEVESAIYTCCQFMRKGEGEEMKLSAHIANCTDSPGNGGKGNYDDYMRNANTR